MKKIFTLVSAVLLSASLWAQAPPQNFSYQAVVRGANNALVTKKQIGMKISLLNGSDTTKLILVYVETHTPTSNENGLVSIAIGGGTKDPSSEAFATIDWSKGPYFVKTETDPAGGTSYSLITTSQLMSVPYALYAANSQPGTPGAKGDKGDAGADGKDGTDGLNGAPGTFPSGTTTGEMKYWDGSSWVSLTPGTQNQGLSFCDGFPTWTTNCICPGKITALNCAGVSVNGSLNNGVPPSSNVSFVITYTGGNGGSYSSQSISSTSVIGLTATLQAGSFATGNGSLTFTVSGMPSSIGNALFSLTIAGQVCSISMVVQAQSTYGADITDVENNTYKTVTIGTQQWMAENLKVSKYNDGSSIPYVTNNAQWSSLTTGSWSYYNNDATYNAKYGKLYNWYATGQIANGFKNVCPTGWHVPTDAQWKVLTDYLGGASAGSKMKEVGTANWNSPNTDATNTSLFTGLPGGFRSNVGYCYSIGDYGYWWSSTQSGTGTAWGYDLNPNGSAHSYDHKYENGMSIRCLKD
jgi:uncharacterized protein (TIGR02145 family)